MTIAEVLFYIIVLIVTVLAIHYVKFKEIHRLPGPSAIKTLFEIFKGYGSSKGVFNRLVHLNVTYGPIAKIWTNPFRPTIVATDLKYVEKFLETTLEKALVFKFLKPYIGLGLASSSGQQWKTHRKLLNPVFHTKILDKYLAISDKHSQELVETLKQHSGKVIDVFPIIHEHTMKLICATFLRTTDIPVVGEKYLEARRFFYGTVIQRLLSLLWQYNFIFKFTNTYKQQTKSCDILKSLSKNIVRNYNVNLQNENSHDYALEKKEFLDVLFEGNNFSDKEVMDQINTFIIAGHDTSESLMSFIFFELARYPDVQRKIVEESIKIIGYDKNAEPSYSQIQQMRYLDATIKEVMRLYTLVPLLDRYVEKDTMIDGRIIPSGTDIMICAYSLHRSEEHFPEPEKFDPDRFMPGNIEKIHPYAYIPFGSGPRTCIGKTFAMATVKGTITKILRNFELVSVDKDLNLEVTTEFVLKPLNDVKVMFMEKSQVL